MCLALLVQARYREQLTLFAKVQKRQSKDEATIAELRERLSTLEAQLRSTIAQNHTLAEENQGYKVRSLSMQESIETLYEDLLSTRGREAQRDETIAELEEARAKDETTILTLNERLLSTSAEKRALAEENKRYEVTLSADLSNAKEEVAQHSTTITDLKEAQAKDQKTIIDLRQQLSTLNPLLLSTSDENRVLAEANKGYEANSLSMQASIDTLSEDVSSAREEVAQHNSTITDLKEARIEDQTAIADLRQQLSMSEARLVRTSAENRDLAEENKRHEADRLSKQESIDTLHEDLSSAREEVAQHNSTITDLEETWVEDQTTIADLRRQLSALKERLTQTIDDYSALAERKKKCKAVLDSKQEYINTLSRQLLSTREVVALHHATITRLKEGQAKAEQTIDVLRKHSAELSIENFQISARNVTLAKEGVTRFTAYQQQMEQKTKAVAYWKDLCMQSKLNPAQAQQVRRRQEESNSGTSESESSTGTIVAQDQEIAQLGAAYRCR
ncbi:hypothetical protein EST38_g9001 [Candolleomyces aberdarensis]|uniref:Uncharacterized protein n=1 Tax=Candolleomyces aberdarensis TaxID=2316362 RepID=A0A4Q2DD89_9AGAR|nr:hypothetical protein EST38_g9001 [Candolleomyces aberdarensis]